MRLDSGFNDPSLFLGKQIVGGLSAPLYGGKNAKTNREWICLRKA
jgi:hypothetical protein